MKYAVAAQTGRKQTTVQTHELRLQLCTAENSIQHVKNKQKTLP